ncbi:MAG: hypothetical protein V5B33_08065 [Candidatus Accumulibacter sp. UW20]|jgi:hypothetical protein
MIKNTQPTFVLALYPTSHGFAFVLFEGPDAPFDWGIKEVRQKSKNSKVLDDVKVLIERYHPEVLVLQNTDQGQARRAARIRRLSCMLGHLALSLHMEVYQFTRAELRDCFASVGAVTKYEIAKAIATQIPAFAHRLPRVRKLWMSEDPRQSLFDAAALGLTYYART